MSSTEDSLLIRSSLIRDLNLFLLQCSNEFLYREGKGPEQEHQQIFQSPQNFREFLKKYQKLTLRFSKHRVLILFENSNLGFGK